MTNRAYRWASAIAASALFFTGACNRAPERTDDSTTATTASPAARNTADRTDNDWWTTTKVQAKFFADSVVKGRNVEVDTNNGIVELRGQVDSAAAKQRAVALAQEVEGVTRVEDRLTVRSSTDQVDAQETPTATTGTDAAVNPAWVTTKIQAQYFAAPDIKPWNIDVTTMSNGHVTLRGEVDDANDRTKAVEIARKTDGVTAVDDRLRVRGEAEGSTAPAAGANTPAPATDAAEPDAWITAKVQSKYFLDDDVKSRDVNVTTEHGVVTLTGQVDSESARRQAISLARSTEGVQDVHDNLKVQGTAASAKPIPPVSQPSSETPDAWITTKIQSKYFIDSSVKALSVDVDTRDGIVTLTGEVTNEAARRAAEQIARDTRGVKRVANRLTIAGAGDNK